MERLREDRRRIYALRRFGFALQWGRCHRISVIQRGFCEFVVRVEGVELG